MGIIPMKRLELHVEFAGVNLSKCKYCNQPAGFLKNYHKECKLKYLLGINNIKSLIKSEFKNSTELQNIKDQVVSIGLNSYINENELKSTVIDGWRSAVEDAFSDGVLSVNEETKLLNMAQQFNFSLDFLNSEPAYIKLVQGGVLREIMEGKLPEKFKIGGDLPFNFQKNEKLIWLFKNVKYHEMKIRKEYTGSYQGVSLKIMKGVYYKTGAFRGNPVETTQVVNIDTGTLGVTDIHLYFSGPKKSFRIKYDKIVAFNQYANGIGIQKDTQNSKPQIFEIDDGWFINNLIINLAKLYSGNLTLT